MGKNFAKEGTSLNLEIRFFCRKKCEKNNERKKNYSRCDSKPDAHSN